jgi:hypothetical protein
MTTQKELLEGEVHSVNEQLYASYKRNAELLEKITELEKTVANQQDVINGLAAG